MPPYERLPVVERGGHIPHMDYAVASEASYESVSYRRPRTLALPNPLDATNARAKGARR